MFLENSIPKGEKEKLSLFCDAIKFLKMIFSNEYYEKEDIFYREKNLEIKLMLILTINKNSKISYRKSEGKNILRL